MAKKRELVVIIKEGIEGAMMGKEGFYSTVGVKAPVEDCPYGWEDGHFTVFPSAKELTDEQIVDAVKELLPRLLPDVTDHCEHGKFQYVLEMKP